MNKLTHTLKQAGFSELACQFSAFIGRIDDGDELVVITAALLTDVVSNGHICLNLADMDERHSLSSYFPDTLKDWIARLKKSKVVGAPGEYVPMVLTDQGLLYLYKHWLAEKQVAEAIKQRLFNVAIKADEVRHYFETLPIQKQGIAWQKVAVLMALTRQFSVISGGPGTGKTTIILHLLKLLKKQQPAPVIALSAPTGKAATRLQDVVTGSGILGLEAKTLHRLLGIDSHHEKGRYHQRNPLPVDVLIIDEASMIGMDLMAKLVRALPDKARLVLLGDSQQLGSVEAGAMLADLCQYGSQFSASFCAMTKQIADVTLPLRKHQDSALKDSIIHLQHNYRFDAKSDIGKLAQAVKSGDITSVYDALATQDMWQQQPFIADAKLHQGYQAYFDAILDDADAPRCLRIFNRYRILCALNQGRESVSFVNNMIEGYCLQQGWQIDRFYHGKPIIILKNDYQQRLFNGDTGLILRDNQGKLSACFWVEGTVRRVALARLPLHDTCFAMTIHKSQGSEFDDVYIVLPEEENPILSRELLYTAITRAKKKVRLAASCAVLTKTINMQQKRRSGLTRRLMT